jgi:hypothetical protein
MLRANRRGLDGAAVAATRPSLSRDGSRASATATVRETISRVGPLDYGVTLAARKGAGGHRKVYVAPDVVHPTSTPGSAVGKVVASPSARRSSTDGRRFPVITLGKQALRRSPTACRDRAG